MDSVDSGCKKSDVNGAVTRSRASSIERSRPINLPGESKTFVPFGRGLAQRFAGDF